MRVFTAIPLPETIKSKVTEITRGRLPVPYVNTDNLHITLNFFGELDSDQVKEIQKVFPEICRGKNKIKVEFDRIVAHHNRQIHLTIKPNKDLNSLQTDLERTFKASGFIFQDRPYYPHVKLANMHLDNVMNRNRKLENFPHGELESLNFTAEKVALYESKLLLHHPKYIPLLEQNLV